MSRRPSWDCETVIELTHHVSDNEMNQRLDEAAGVLVECLGQLQSSNSILSEIPVSDLLRDQSRDRTGTDG
jgi:hypothetical protein